MTTAVTLKKKRRKMKQMQGLLLLARPQQSVTTADGKTLFGAFKKVLVVLQPQQLQLAYSAQEDQDMAHILGRIDLRGAQLEQLPDGFIIHESGTGKKFRLQDRDKATTDAWFFGVYAAITEFTRLPIPASEDHSRRFSAVLSASLLDEVTQEPEYELSCQLFLPARPLEKPSIRWKVWKTFAQLQAFDDELRASHGSFMKKLLFPRERKRDSLFGLRKKHTQELKEQQLAQYIEKVCEVPGASSDIPFLDKVKRFLGFDSFFEIKQLPVEEEITNQGEPASQCVAPIDPVNDENQPIPEQETPELFSEPVYSLERRNSSSYDLENRRSSIQSIDNLPPLSRTGSFQFDDVGTEYVEIVPETDPKAAKKLHKSILQRVGELVANDEDRVREFQDQTRYFGRDEISTTEYCAFLLGAFGSKECCQLIPMMARLLPDDDKRNELMDGRSAIWRRTIRRNRRRSKQFSESVVFQQQRNEVVHETVVHKMRPKSDSLTAMQWYQEKDMSHVPSRNSMVESPSPAFLPPRSSSSGNQESGIDTGPPSFKKPMLDPRRKLQHRASFSVLGDSVSDPIQEENSLSVDSDDENPAQTGSIIASGFRRGPPPSLERKSSLAGSRWSRHSQSRLSNVSSGEEQQHYFDDEHESNVDYKHRRSSLKSELESAPPPAEEENPRVREAKAIARIASPSDLDLISSFDERSAVRIAKRGVRSKMAAVTSEELQEAWQKVKKTKSLPDPPTIKLPLFSAKTPMKTRLAAIQHVINTLEYNYTGTLYFDVNKNRSFKSIVSTAKDIINEALPIQCLEAVFLGAYLTANAPVLERFPISFKTVAGATVHRHIILAVRHQHTKWGALGLSRSEKLMFKELKYTSLSELIQDFIHEFELLFHSVLKVYVGFPFSHDIHSSEKVEWRVMNISLELNAWTGAAHHFDTFSKEAVDILTFKKSKGVLPDSFAAKFPLHTPEAEPGKKSSDKRMHLSASSFEYPAAALGDDDEENTSPPPAVERLKGEQSPEKDDSKLLKPILIAPDHLEFKQALASSAQVLPTNIFLQNTTAFPYLVEIEERSGLLEIVTRGAVTKQHQEDEGNNAITGSSGAYKSSAATFRVSAKGMTVVAIKFNGFPAGDASEHTGGANNPPIRTPASSKGPYATTAKAPKVHGSTTPKAHGSATARDHNTASVRHVVTFRCRRLVRVTHEDASLSVSEIEEGEVYVNELPFAILTAS